MPASAGRNSSETHGTVNSTGTGTGTGLPIFSAAFARTPTPPGHSCQCTVPSATVTAL
ncbi:hypothetical protein [Actinocorallia aurantiaca]|uniref:Uncharacterized protein n=1 Tax=Actinocorallia aurantiaca TaxID=46204 RepID=A0ABP6H5Q2_9ACTN